jgi:DNA topoisomerase III
MKTLYIAEKPDIGRTLAAYLWKDDCKKETGYIRNGDTAVTWAIGHILMQGTPEMYGEEYKVWANYPIIPQRWITKPAANTAKQFDVVAKLLKDADVVVHAGDPDREGQLLIDEILDYCNFKGEVRRLLLSAKDDESLKRAFSDIRDNSEFEGLYHAGLARTRADWLIGMNLSRAYTVNARKYGYTTVFRIGRVKIPTLALVVQREKEIQQFKSRKFYELTGTFEKDDISFTAKYTPSATISTDEEGRVLDKKLLQAIKLKIDHTDDVVVSDVEKKTVTQQPPLPFSLDTLQIEANKVYGLSPKDTLDTVQSLYEKKIVSYPRSDCNYIPASQQGDADKIIAMLASGNALASMTDAADPSISGKAFDDAKITAHHAIIPTGEKPTNLTENEQNIFDMIAKRYLVQFYKPFIFEKTSFKFSVGDEIFVGSGREILELGFRAVEKEDQDAKEPVLSVPTLSVGDAIGKQGTSITEKKTTPPKRFTEGTLIAAMTNIWRFVAADNPNREKLKETKGIGTPATRDTIIAELLATENKGKPIEACLTKKKKELIPSDFGIKLIENVAPSLTLPDATAEMEYALSEIASGKKTMTSYIDEIIDVVNDNIRFAETREFPLVESEDAVTCPICGKGTLLKKFSPKLQKHFYICSDDACVLPEDGRKMFYEDEKGQPIIEHCPACRTVLRRLNGKNGPFWLCAKCSKTYNDKHGHPELKK